MIVLSDSRFEEHVTPPGHPERVERAHVMASVARVFAQSGTVVSPRPVTRDELERVHETSYLDRIADLAGRSAMLDADTFTSPESVEIASLAAGATVQAAELAIKQKTITFAFVRPPGHHAERNQAMGFCLYNNVAVAAGYALAFGLERVAVVDIDVHHGNGTQHIFYDEPRVLYVSSHQFPFYPGTGAAGETGSGAGAGFTVNLPLEAGATDADYDLAYRAIAIPVLEQFAPQLTLVSAGYDAHEADPLASMRMSAGGYARLLARLRAAATTTGGLALTIEGGYDLPALRECLQSSLAVLDADHVGVVDDEAFRAQPTPRGDRAVHAARAALASFWRL